MSKEANQCILQETVPEGIGTFNLTLFRHGNLAFRLGVVCYTDGIHTEDYIQRPKADPDSIVYFLPGQSETYCPITIVDDKLNEQKEHFDVKIEIPETEYGHVDHLKESMCVYIDHDVADGGLITMPYHMYKSKRVIYIIHICSYLFNMHTHFGQCRPQILSFIFGIQCIPSIHVHV